jgi:hypothetical protein
MDKLIAERKEKFTERNLPGSIIPDHLFEDTFKKRKHYNSYGIIEIKKVFDIVLLRCLISSSSVIVRSFIIPNNSKKRYIFNNLPYTMIVKSPLIRGNANRQRGLFFYKL